MTEQPKAAFAAALIAKNFPHQTLSEIINTAAEVWDVDASDIVGRLTHRQYSDPRHAAAAVAVEAGFSSRSIADAFDGRTYEFASLAALRSELLQRESLKYAEKLYELRDLLANDFKPRGNPYEQERLSIEHLIESVAEDFNISPALLKSKMRRMPLPAARAVVYKLLSEQGLSFAGIGRNFNRDHSTVMHGLGCFERYMLEYPTVAKSYSRHRRMRQTAEHTGEK